MSIGSKLLETKTIPSLSQWMQFHWNDDKKTVSQISISSHRRMTVKKLKNPIHENNARLVLNFKVHRTTSVWRMIRKNCLTLACIYSMERNDYEDTCDNTALQFPVILIKCEIGWLPFIPFCYAENCMEASNTRICNICIFYGEFMQSQNSIVTIQ